ncbi:MAG: glycine cleavage T C-terminal barrel domain-containing protein [Planctomycetota bacterium]
MAHPSPLRQRHLDADASLLPYGPPETDIELAETFDALELEYAALRKRCVLVDRPDRGTVVVTGADRIAFLNNMVTQELSGIEPGDTRDSFWLNRKGRIDADLRLVQLADRAMLDVDAHAAAATADSLSQFLFAEDCEIRDETQAFHRLQLIGPTSADLLAIVAAGGAASIPASGRASECRLADVPAVVDHDPALGVPAFGLTVRAADAERLEEALLAAGSPAGLGGVGQEDGHIDDDGSPASRVRLRRAGWHAVNIARIEAGRPRFMLDFGPNNLPGETGLLHDRVSFTKGCYLGQEVVARMNALGHPKQILVALTCEKRTLGPDRLDPVHPVTGSHVFVRGDAAKPVGAVTSATLSPSLGNVPVCFAQVRWGHHEPATELTIQAEGLELDATVHGSLRLIEG